MAGVFFVCWYNQRSHLLFKAHRTKCVKSFIDSAASLSNLVCKKLLKFILHLKRAFTVVTFAYSQHPSSTQTASPWSQRGHLIISKRQVCTKDLLTGEEKRLWKCSPAALLKCPFRLHFSWLRGALARPWITPGSIPTIDRGSAQLRMKPEVPKQLSPANF